MRVFRVRVCALGLMHADGAEMIEREVAFHGALALSHDYEFVGQGELALRCCFKYNSGQSGK